MRTLHLLFLLLIGQQTAAMNVFRWEGMKKERDRLISELEKKKLHKKARIQSGPDEWGEDWEILPLKEWGRCKMGSPDGCEKFKFCLSADDDGITIGEMRKLDKIISLTRELEELKIYPKKSWLR